MNFLVFLIKIAVFYFIISFIWEVIKFNFFLNSTTRKRQNNNSREEKPSKFNGKKIIDAKFKEVDE